MTNVTTVAVNGSSLPAVTVDTNRPAPIDRRSFLVQAAATAILMGAATPAFGEPADPIFAAIEQHRTAMQRYREACAVHCHLERTLPRDKCRSCVDVHGEKIVDTDDPRWVESERSMDATSDAETDAACALVNVLPTTPAGVIALLNHAITADVDGHLWPPSLGDDEGKDIRSWHHFLIANLAGILPQMFARAS